MTRWRGERVIGGDPWIHALVDNWYPGDEFVVDDLSLHYYEMKYETAARLKPTHIVELGVRAGYSAFAFLSAVPEAYYLGIDNGMCDAEQGDQYIAHAHKILKRFAHVSFLAHDIQKLERFAMTPWSWETTMAHVDADHSFEGCFHDLKLCSVAKWILVDDYGVGKDIREACDEVLTQNPSWTAEFVHDGLRGSLLITTQ